MVTLYESTDSKCLNERSPCPWPAGTDEAGQGEEWQILAQ